MTQFIKREWLENEIDFKATYEIQSDDNPNDVLKLMFTGDGDVILSLFDEKKGFVSVRVCTSQGGGRHLSTRKALADVMRAIIEDNKPPV